ncbi:MAG: hypothetical protein ACREHV_01175, partial [Rhizomicrobium sp.]
ALAARRRAFPTAPRESQPPVVLFFAPDAGLVPHFVTHLIVARTLKALGHRVLIVRCFRQLLPRCIVVEANALPVAAAPADRKRICERCAQTSLTMADAYGLETVDLADVIDDEMRRRLRTLMAAAPQDLGQFRLDDVAIGEFANGDLSRILKVNNPAELGGAARDHLRQYIETAALCYLAAEKLCERLNVSRFVYFNDYAMTLAADAAARRQGIPTTHLSHVPVLNNDRRRIVMLSGYAPLEGLRRLRTWPQWRGIALTPEAVAVISEDTFLRFAGSGFTIYSPAWSAKSTDLFEGLKLNRSRRLLVAYTSSEDEIRGVRYYESALGVEIYPGKSAFTDQFEWLQALVEYVEGSPDLQLVIRVHPREAPNRREQRTSENLKELQRRFSGAYRNVRVVWPADRVSSYDLAEIADVGLIALSNIGHELVRMGVPVMAAFPYLAEIPAGIFIDWSSRDDYFAGLRRAVDDPPPALERVVAAFRWLYGRFVQYSVDCGDVIPAPDYAGLPPFSLPKNARIIEDVLISGRLLPDVNNERLTQAQRRDSAEREREAVARHFRAFFHLLMFGRRPDGDYRLALGDDAGAAQADFQATIAGGMVTLRGRGLTATKFSPMAARMARLGAQSMALADAAEAH